MSDTTDFPCPHCGAAISLAPKDFTLLGRFYSDVIVCPTCSGRCFFPWPVRLLTLGLTLLCLGAGVLLMKGLGILEPETPFDFVAWIASFFAIGCAALWIDRAFCRGTTTHLVKIGRSRPG